MVTGHRGTCKSIVSSLTSCPGSVDALRQSHVSLFQSRPYCECYSKAYGVSLHSRALKPISGPERNIPTGHRLGDATFDYWGFARL